MIKSLQFDPIVATLITGIVCACSGCPTSDADGIVGGTCGTSDDALFITNSAGFDLSVTIGYPDGTTCDQEAVSGPFAPSTRTNASFVVGEVYTFQAFPPAGSLVAPSATITCTVDVIAVTNGAATVQVLLPTLTSQLVVECLGNWVEQ